MEPVGLVIGYVGFTTALLQQVDDIAKAFDQVKDNSGQASNFNVEIRALKETLLVVRDLAEQQGTEEAKVQTLAILAAESRSLGALLGELQLRGSKLDSSSLWQRLSRTKVKQILERVKGHRETLDLLLSTSGFLSPNDNSDGTNQGEPSGPSANIITEWLGYPNFSERLEVLQDRYVTGTGTWLLENPLFQQWLKEPGKPLWCTGQGELLGCTSIRPHGC
ncbi:hypothetical protein FVEN_g161 [Fusarium venenatum]|uniref:Fungal N-terminal domain-containing protein n=1 Tax=Fusarium venenatum TaxID=56646 RepID=A0A2L2TTC7_9HYPO|nr:uncharacterized protein FVRRES_07741 [Fusarium venenatum]KAG8362105.1 hypothetical protein FVEN_g161 [Fusarium venenatum]CEI63305.1 unnamed protein product [Fusarium venenatum]